MNVVRSEWLKLWSVRSTPWSLVALVAVTVGFSALICAVTTLEDIASAEFDATAQSLVGGYFGQVAAVVLGVLCITSEYSQGGIRTTLTAVPRRMHVVGAKVLVVAATTLLAGLVSTLVSFHVGQAILAGKDASVGLGDPQVLRAVLGGALYLMGCGLFGLALGVLLRQSAAAITGAVVLLFVSPPLIDLVPGEAGAWLSTHWTSIAGSAIMSVEPAEGILEPWTGYGVFTLWWVVLLAAGAVLLARRDAA